MVQIGLIPGDTPTDGTGPNLPAVAQASKQARKSQQAYDNTLELMGADHPSTKYIREQLDKELAKAGPTAQLKNLKQISDHKLAISKHGDEAKKDQERIRAIEKQRVDVLEQELGKQKAYQVQMEATFKEHNDLTAQALQRMVEMERQVKALENAAEHLPAPTPTTTPATTTTNDDLVLAMAKMQPIVEELMNPTSSTTDANVTLQQRLTEVVTQITQRPTPTPIQFGPAAQTKGRTNTREHPFGDCAERDAWKNA